MKSQLTKNSGDGSMLTLQKKIKKSEKQLKPSKKKSGKSENNTNLSLKKLLHNFKKKWTKLEQGNEIAKKINPIINFKEIYYICDFKNECKI